MKRFFGILVVTIAALLAVSRPTLAGISTHGGDLPNPFAEVAWFYKATGPVHYCIEVSNDFGQSVDQIQSSFEHAFAAWTAYLNARRPIGIFFNKLADTVVRDSACHATTALRLLAGGIPAEVQESLGLFSDPIAFAFHSRFDPDSLASSGYIWLSSPKSLTIGHWPESSTQFQWNWQIPGLLDGTMLHEVGHIFGMSHIEGTIMTEGIVESLIAKSRSGEQQDPLRIDWTHEVLTASGDALGKTVRYAGISRKDLDRPLDIATLCRLFGRDFDPSKTKLDIVVNPTGMIQPGYYLESTDQNGLMRLMIDVISEQAVDLGRTASYLAKADGPASMVGSEERRATFIVGRIIGREGAPVSVLLKQNVVAYVPLTVETLEAEPGGSSGLLFEGRIAD